MNKRIKFRSGLNKYIFIALAVYHLMIVLPFILNTFLWRDIITWYGYLLLAIDVFFLLPLIFNTYYSLEDTYLFVYQWPFSRIKIYYNDIFIIDNEFPADAEKKYKKKYGFSNKQIIVGYYAEALDRKEKKVKKIKKYAAISPADYDAFMIRIGGKFSSAKKVAAKLEETLQINEDKHKKKKEEVAKQRRRKAEKNKPVDVVVQSKKKTDLVSVSEEKAKSEETAENADYSNITVSANPKKAKIKIEEDGSDKQG